MKFWGPVGRESEQTETNGIKAWWDRFPFEFWLGDMNAHVRSVESLIQDIQSHLGGGHKVWECLFPWNILDPHEGDYMNSRHS